MKTDYGFMSEIKADELYDKLVSYGMFSENLPPIFAGDLFLNYCKNIRKQTFSNDWRGYINYENMRNTNIPRNIGISTPMGYELLYKTLMKHWTELTEYFREKTKGQPKIISRIHIRIAGDNDELYFRDYLNEYKEIAKEYETLNYPFGKNLNMIEMDILKQKQIL